MIIGQYCKDEWSSEKEQSDLDTIQVGVVGYSQVHSKHFSIMFQLSSWEIKSLIKGT